MLPYEKPQTQAMRKRADLSTAIIKIPSESFEILEK